jgi:hypothetical protein
MVVSVSKYQQQCNQGNSEKNHHVPFGKPFIPTRIMQCKHQIIGGQKWNTKIFEPVKPCDIMQGFKGYFECIKEGINSVGDEQENYKFSLSGIVSVPNKKCHNDHYQKGRK